MRTAERAPAWALALAAMVRERRKQLQLTQVDTAHLAGVGPDFLYDLEQGKPTIRLGTLMRVLDALGIEVQFLPRAGAVS